MPPGYRQINLGNPISSHPLNRGLAAAYIGLPGSSGGTRFLDLLARYPLTLSGATWRPRPAPIANDILFDGTASYLEGIAPVTANPFTLACRFNATNQGQQATLVSVGVASGGDQSRSRILASSSINGSTVTALTTDSAGSQATATSSTTYTAQSWNHCLGVFASATDRRVFLNGGGKGTDATSKTVGTLAKLNVGCEQRTVGTYRVFFPGWIESVWVWNRALGDDEAALHAILCSQSYSQLLNRYTPRARSFGAPVAGGNAYTLNLGPGSFTYTGSSATLLANRLLNLGTGSFTLTGIAATLSFKRVLNAGTGSFALTGIAATLKPTRFLNLGTGSFTLTGSSLTFLNSKVLNAGPGSYSVTGSPATLAFTRKLNAATGSYAVTGTNAAFTTGKSFQLAPGAYSVTGSAASLIRSRILNLGTGSYNVTGKSATLLLNGVGPGGGDDLLLLHVGQ